MRMGLLLLFAVFTTFLSAHDIERDRLMWKSAYNGNFSLAHKLSITRKTKDINDELLNRFVMAYVHYKMGNPKEVESVFKGIDSYIDGFFIRRD